MSKPRVYNYFHSSSVLCFEIGFTPRNFFKANAMHPLQNAMHPLNVQCDPKLSENPFLLNFFVAPQLQDAPAGP